MLRDKLSDTRRDRGPGRRTQPANCHQSWETEKARRRDKGTRRRTQPPMPGDTWRAAKGTGGEDRQESWKTAEGRRKHLPEYRQCAKTYLQQPKEPQLKFMCIVNLQTRRTWSLHDFNDHKVWNGKQGIFLELSMHQRVKGFIQLWCITLALHLKEHVSRILPVTESTSEHKHKSSSGQWFPNRLPTRIQNPSGKVATKARRIQDRISQFQCKCKRLFHQNTQ